MGLGKENVLQLLAGWVWEMDAETFQRTFQWAKDIVPHVQTMCVVKIRVGGDQKSMGLSGRFTGPCCRFMHLFAPSEHPQIHLCLPVPMAGASAGKSGFGAGSAAGTGLSPHGWVFLAKRWGRMDLFGVQVTFAYVLISKFCSGDLRWNVLAGGRCFWRLLRLLIPFSCKWGIDIVN